MYEALVARVRYHIQKANFMGLKDAESTLLLKEAADAIEELSKKYLASEVDNTNLTGWLAEEYAKHLWIPVTERLPLLNTPVLATDGIEVDISWMYGVPPRWITSYTAIDEDKLTHWMPLPQTPKGGES